MYSANRTTDHKHILTMRYPASWWRSQWREAMPSGNGNIGASVYGGVYEETVLLNHELLWRKGSTPELPDISAMLPEVRRLVSGGEAETAEVVLAGGLRASGYEPKIASPLPLGDLKIFMPQRQAFRDYERRLNMATGEIVVGWKDGGTAYERALFVSRTDDAVVLEIRKQGPLALDARLAFQLHNPEDTRRPGTAYIPQEVETKRDGDYLYYAARNNDGSDFGAVARISARSGTMGAGEQDCAIEGADSLLAIIRLFPSGEREREWERLTLGLREMDDDYGSLLARHGAEHGRLFHASSFDLKAKGRERSNEELLMEAYRGETPDALMEKMWAYGRYLLISASREKGQPCHLYGLWAGDYDALWAFHMVNENLQMMYWQALSGNMPDQMLAVFDYMESLMDDFRTNARRLYGCRGIYIPAPTAPDSGLLKNIQPHIIHWTGGAGWISQLYYDYYLHTGDAVFLRDRAIPFMREAAWFYRDFFILGEDGFFVSSPSNSPENTPGNYWKGPRHSMGTTMNATMDFAIAKELLGNLADGLRAIGDGGEEEHQWRAMLERIPPYQINGDGAIREWMHPDFDDNYHHRHQSHAYPVFPGIEVTRQNDPELFGSFVQAIRKRLVIGLKEQSGWSLAHMANNYARMGEGDLALECLDILGRSCVMNNLMTLHNDWRGMGIGVDMDWTPVQLDANMGWTAAVQEMLLFSVPGELHLLPALPSRWIRGSAGPLLSRGGVQCELDWDRGEQRLDVTLRAGGGPQVVQLVLPDFVARIQNFEYRPGLPVSVELDERPLRLHLELQPPI
ncbi:alpha-L-fucosidase [Paenibacillus sp. MY03]|uniref:glycosyl hydrolase family 95 catalytic domain-containing protein n=1 Tax=Paenibacillus sp. MY03 TaxID=302980 RepID=UPI000B3CEE74|nr:glycoside hydrolase N-terminal domain-containing protein [Paenibacillus sp. MY03]OUS76698.1 alpha-L-fucosidase [Paenibacillus sp. MY03]